MNEIGGGKVIGLIAVGAFAGGLLAGAEHMAGVAAGAVVMALSFLLLALVGMFRRSSAGSSTFLLLGLAATIQLPCGVVGYALGKAWWG